MWLYNDVLGIIEVGCEVKQENDGRTQLSYNCNVYALMSVCVFSPLAPFSFSPAPSFIYISMETAAWQQLEERQLLR